MADYQLTATEVVIRNADGANIPPDPANADRIEYDKWLAEGGVPDPYVAPEPTPPEPSPEDELLFDHENRIRGLEGQPPVTPDEFRARATR